MSNISYKPTQGFILFGTVAKKHGPMKFYGSFHKRCDAYPKFMGEFLKEHLVGYFPNMGNTALYFYLEMERHSDKLTVLSPPDDFTQVDWVYCIYKMENQLEYGELCIRLFDHGRLVYDGPLENMPVYEKNHVQRYVK